MKIARSNFTPFTIRQIFQSLGAVSADDAAELQAVIDAYAMNGAKGIMRLENGKTYILDSSLNWDDSKGGLIINAEGAKVVYTDSDYLLRASMPTGGAGVNVIEIHGGEWHGNANSLGLFRAADVRQLKVKGGKYYPKGPGNVGGIILHLINDHSWSERVEFSGECRGMQHAVLCEVASTADANGGTKSFARLQVNITVQDGVSGQPLIEMLDSSTAVGQPSVYSSSINVRGNINDGVIVSRITGGMGGTKFLISVEATSGTGYFFVEGSELEGRPILAQPFYLQNCQLYSGTPSDYLLEYQEFQGIRSINRDGNRGVDILGRTGDYLAAANQDNPALFPSSNGGSFPFDVFGNLVIQGNPKGGRGVVLAAGNPAELKVAAVGNQKAARVQGLELLPITSAQAVNNSLFVDSADNLLKWKNDSGTVQVVGVS